MKPRRVDTVPLENIGNRFVRQHMTAVLCENSRSVRALFSKKSHDRENELLRMKRLMDIRNKAGPDSSIFITRIAEAGQYPSFKIVPMWRLQGLANGVLYQLDIYSKI